MVSKSNRFILYLIPLISLLAFRVFRYKGQDIAYTLAPTEDVEMTKSTVSSVPITPDNFHT